MFFACYMCGILRPLLHVNEDVGCATNWARQQFLVEHVGAHSTEHLVITSTSTQHKQVHGAFKAHGALIFVKNHDASVLEIIYDLPIGFPINNIISLSPRLSCVCNSKPIAAMYPAGIRSFSYQ